MVAAVVPCLGNPFTSAVSRHRGAPRSLVSHQNNIPHPIGRLPMPIFDLEICLTASKAKTVRVDRIATADEQCLLLYHDRQEDGFCKVIEFPLSSERQPASISITFQSSFPYTCLLVTTKPTHIRCRLQHTQIPNQSAQNQQCRSNQRRSSNN